MSIPDETESSHAHRLQVRIPEHTVRLLQFLIQVNFLPRAHPPYLLVISKVVPKIWARTNSAMVKDRDLGPRWR